MAFTEKGKAGRKTRLLRHGKFDWRHAVFGPPPKDDAPELTAKDKAVQGIEFCFVVLGG